MNTLKTYGWIVAYIGLGLAVTYSGILTYWLIFVALTTAIIGIQQRMINTLREAVSPFTEAAAFTEDACQLRLARIVNLVTDDVDENILDVLTGELDELMVLIGYLDSENRYDYWFVADQMQRVIDEYRSKPFNGQRLRLALRLPFVSQFNKFP